MPKSSIKKFYQTTHLSSAGGFIRDPTGQLKSSANSCELLIGPITLNCPGEWTPVVTRFIIAVK